MKRVFIGILTISVCFLSACGSMLPANEKPTQNTASTTVTPTDTTTTTLELTTLPTRAEAVLPDAVETPQKACAYSGESVTGTYADLLYWEGEVYHAVQLITALTPSDGEVGKIQSAVSRDTVPAANGQCNSAALVGQTVYRAGDTLYTPVTEGFDSDVYAGVAFRQWQKGVARYEGPVLGGALALQFEGSRFLPIYALNVEEGSLDSQQYVVTALPENKGFVYGGTVLAVGMSAPLAEYGSNIGGLGRDIYASAAYPSFLYVGNEQVGFWVMARVEKSLVCGSIRQADTMIDLSAATEEDVQYLASLIGKDRFAFGSSAPSLGAFGIGSITAPNDTDWAQLFRLKAE